MQIREVQPCDGPQWLAMRRQLWPDADNRTEVDAFLAGRGRAGDAVFVAGTEDGTLCGFIELSLRHDYVEGASESPVAFVEGWFVLPDRRNRGIGRRLLRQAEQWAVSRGCQEIAGDADATNASAIAAHQACGYSPVATLVHFLRKIPPDPGHTPPMSPVSPPENRQTRIETQDGT